jgi:hypothetical protein
MKDEGKYLHLWMKYSHVMRVLLKKTDEENQKLRLFKHEFDSIGAKTNSGFVFSLELKNGKAIKTTNTTAIARDLVQLIDNDNALRNVLKDRSIKVSLDKTYELQLEKI